MTVQIIHNFISANEADFIVKNFSHQLTKINNREGFFEDYFLREAKEFDIMSLDTKNKFDNELENIASALINHSFFLAKNKIEAFYNIKIKHIVGGMTKLITGASNGLHADMYNLDGTEIKEDKNAKKLKYSGLLYLSEYKKDFDGGILKFPKQNLSIEPKPGLFVFFEGNADHPHEVTEIINGERHAVIMFFG